MTKVKYTLHLPDIGECCTFTFETNDGKTVDITAESDNQYILDLVTQILNRHKKKVELVVGYSKDTDVRALNEANNRTDCAAPYSEGSGYTK